MLAEGLGWGSWMEPGAGAALGREAALSSPGMSLGSLRFRDPQEGHPALPPVLGYPKHPPERRQHKHQPKESRCFPLLTYRDKYRLGEGERQQINIPKEMFLCKLCCSLP